MENKLLPCPFCGGKALPDIGNQNGEEADQWFVMCQCCAAEGPWFYERGNAITAWNTRALSERHQRLVEAAKGILNAITVLCVDEYSCFSTCSLANECDKDSGNECLLVARLRAALEEEE